MRIRALLLSLALVVPACFDVAKVPPGKFFIDDFEGTVPVDKRFGQWTCNAFKNGQPEAAFDGGPRVTCSVVDQRGENGGSALAVPFELVGVMGVFSTPEVMTAATMGTVNFKTFAQLVVSAILETGSGLPNGTQLRVELGCGDSSLYTDVVGIRFDSDWSTFQLPWDLFLVPAGSQVTSDACLLRIDSVRFLVRPGRGTSAGGTLLLDNVYLL